MDMRRAAPLLGLGEIHVIIHWNGIAWH